jgi:integration host factor subunit beta
MNKENLIDRVAQENELSKTKAKFLVNLVFQSMMDALAQGDRVEIRGFGTFAVKNYEAYEGRNPKTGEVVKVKSKTLPVFRAGKRLKEKVNS